VLPGEFCGWAARGSSKEAVPSAGTARRYSSHACAAGILKWQVRGGIRVGAVCITAPTRPVRGLFRPRPWAGPCPSVAGSSAVGGPLVPRNPAPTDA
jgi:hypothetical protein